MRLIVLSFIMLLQQTAMGQYAPQAGLSGSTAISSSSSDIVGWAAHCSVQRGFINIATPSLGLVSAGDSVNATGAANGSIVCLGDSGIAVLTFPAGIYNGAGPDFAIFENGFKDPANPSMAFLELAFVEVSSDGINYYRFPANSNTSTNTQIPGSGVYMDAALINNLAGKYVATYGTPFDLQELAGETALNINNITHVRIVDAIGSVSGHSSLDVAGNVINDPYPTNFPTGGFDLDAVGALHMNSTGLSMPGNALTASVFPNPANDKITITVSTGNTTELSATLTSITGCRMLQTAIHNSTTVSIAPYPAGMYYLTISDANGTQWAGKIIKY